jgi:8-oxo-dGTP diphosphatase
MISDPKYCPQCGAALKTRVVADRARPVCPVCGFIFYLNPIVAAGTLIEQEGRVALVRRGREPGPGLWALPTGYVELDESAEEAAVRETWEEVHLHVQLDGLLDAFSYSSPQSRGVLLIYAAHVVSGVIEAGDDAIDAAWFGPHELPGIAFRIHRDVLRRWQQARAVTYRLASLADAEVVDMLSQVHSFEYGSEYATFVSDPDKQLFVAVASGQIVGFAAITLSVHHHTAHIEGIFVHPRYRRWGIGTRLIQTCLDFSQGKGVQAVFADAPLADSGWLVYLNAGFRVSGFTNDYYAPRSDVPETALLLTFDITGVQ